MTAIYGCSTSLRTKSLEEWCKANSLSVPDKVAVAERVIDVSVQADQIVSIFAPDRGPLIRKLRADLIVALKIDE
jgi:hypothetical protein